MLTPVSSSPPFEDPSLSVWMRIRTTWWQIIRHPQQFFFGLNVDEFHTGAASRFAFWSILLGTVGKNVWALFTIPIVQSAVVQQLRALSQQAPTPEQPVMRAQLQEFLLALSTVETELWLSLCAAPFLALSSVHLLAGLIHVSCRVWRPLDEEPVPYEATFRFVAYAQAPMLLGLLPVLGSLNAMWMMLVMGIAMGALHRLRFFGLLSGVLLPLLLVNSLWGFVLSTASDRWSSQIPFPRNALTQQEIADIVSSSQSTVPQP